MELAAAKAVFADMEKHIAALDAPPTATPKQPVEGIRSQVMLNVPCTWNALSDVALR